MALQDYNEEVLSAVTRPNVEANLARMPPGGLRPRVRYFAGDWGGLGDLLAVEGGYDLVLAAETVYERAPSLRFLELLKRAVAVEGVALVAAKTYYFGVGGGSREFAGLVREDGFFTVRLAWHGQQRRLPCRLG